MTFRRVSRSLVRPSDSGTFFRNHQPLPCRPPPYYTPPPIKARLVSYPSVFFPFSPSRRLSDRLLYYPSPINFLCVCLHSFFFLDPVPFRLGFGVPRTRSRQVIPPAFIYCSAQRLSIHVVKIFHFLIVEFLSSSLLSLGSFSTLTNLFSNVMISRFSFSDYSISRSYR